MLEIDQDDHMSDEADGGSDLPAMNTELARTLGDIVAQLVGDLMQIDLQLVKCKRALALLQPKKDGRLDLKFWKKETIPGKHPAPVRWRRLKAGLQPPRRGVKQDPAAVAQVLLNPFPAQQVMANGGVQLRLEQIVNRLRQQFIERRFAQVGN